MLRPEMSADRNVGFCLGLASYHDPAVAHCGRNTAPVGLAVAALGERQPTPGTARRMMWVEHVRTWGCAECAWVFGAGGPPQGDPIEEMRRNFEAKRNQEFQSHV